MNEYFCSVNYTSFIYLAPLEGLTEIEFRNVFTKHFGGIDAAIAPFVSLMNHEATDKRRSWDIPIVDDQLMKTVPQFMGRNIKDFHHLAQWIVDKGYNEINWNLGCPVKRVVRRGRGCGQLKQPDEIKYFLDEVFRNQQIGFSIKTRLGLDNPDEIYKLIEIYNQYPLTELILHPRIGKQLYSGEIMFDYLDDCVSLSKNKFVYSGDIKTVSDFKIITEKFPSIKRIMIGRGLLKDPFLAEKIKGIRPINAPPDFKRLLNYLEELYIVFDAKFWNKIELLGKMKNYWQFLSFLFDDRNRVFKYIVHSKDMKEYHQRIREILS